MKQHQFDQKKPTSGVRYLPLRQRGDTLIEVLITFFVISVGILGASSMQITALKNLNGAQYRDRAVIFAENLAEEMRATDTSVHNSLETEYKNAVKDSLPSGDLRRNSSNGVETITVRWDEDRSGSEGRNCPIKTDEDLDCYRIIFRP